MAKVIIITLGESGVGKTSLLNRFRTGKFKESPRSTFVDHFSKTITIENIKTEAIIWDTAGQERYNSLIKRYYAMADGVLLMYDVNDTLTFSKLSKWLNELRSENETAEIIIVGNKNEDPTRKLVSSLDVQNFIDVENLQHVEASAKTGENVDLIFQSLTEKILTARGILQVLTEQQQNMEDNSNLQSSNMLKNEPEISFTYYIKPDLPENTICDEERKADLSDEDKSSTNCFSCLWG